MCTDMRCVVLQTLGFNRNPVFSLPMTKWRTTSCPDHLLQNPLLQNPLQSQPSFKKVWRNMKALNLLWNGTAKSPKPCETVKVRLTPSSFIGFPTAFWSCSCWSRLTASWKPMTRSPAPWTPTALNRRLIYIGHVRSDMFREEVHVCLMLILMYRHGIHRTYQAAQAPKRCSSTRRCSGSKRFRFFFLRRT